MPLESQAKGASLIISATSSQRSCPKCRQKGPWSGSRGSKWVEQRLRRVSF